MKNGFLKCITGVAIGVAVSVSATSQADVYFNEVGSAVYKQRAAGEGTGYPTEDIANILNGVVNVEAVFGIFHVNEEIRDLDTRACGEIGVKELAKGTESTGRYCCERLWEIEGKDLMSSFGIRRDMGGALGGYDDHKKSRLRSRFQFLDYCCRLSDDKARGDYWVFCRTKADEKVGCVQGQMKNGADLDGALSACEMTCDIKVYGTMKHNEGETYSPEEVDNIVRKCVEAELEWAPSTTVPNPEEFAPVVPENIRDF